MGDQKTQQTPEHAAKPHEKDTVKSTHSSELAVHNDTHILSRLSSAGSLPPISGKGLSHPTAATHQAAILRTLQRRQGNAFVQRAVIQGRSAAGISEHAVEQAQSDQSSSQSLDTSTQADMEASFGQDFSRVRIHTDENAAALAQGIHAQAFTKGQDIYFGAGRYQPGTPQGKHLLAHELTHTIQQKPEQSLARSTTVSDPDEPMEQEAEAVAHQMVDHQLTPAKVSSTVSSDKQEVITRAADPQPPDKQAVDMAVVNNAVDIIINGLKGITTRKDSANILAQFQGQNAAMARAIIQELKNRGSQNGKSPEEMVGWLFGDMTAEDSRALRQLLIQLGVVEDIARIVATLVIDRLKGYTSDEDSQEILTALIELKGSGLDEVLTRLETQTGKSSDQMSDWLFGDMERGNSEQLRQYFFSKSGGAKAAYYATVRTASKIMSLLSGYTSHADSSSIVWNFEHTPQDYQPIVLALLDKRTRAERSQSAADALMHDMDQSDYEALRAMPALSLPPYHDTRSRFTRFVSGIVSVLDWGEVALEVLAGGVVGVVTGIISVLADVVSSVKDLAVAAKHLVMSFLYLVSYGAIGSEDWLAVKEFFSGIKGLTDPGALLKKAWEEMKLESSTIEGPFEYGRRAEFWVRKVIGLIGNILLIAAAGYGLVKAGVSAVTEVAKLIDEFGIIGGLAKAGRQALRAVGKFISLSFQDARKLLAKLMKPLQTLTTIRQKINVILLVVKDKGLWVFLREHVEAVVAHEKDWWQEKKETWQNRAIAKQKQHADLLDEANTLQGNLEQQQAPPSPVENVKGIDDDADQLKKEVDQLEKDVLGKEQPEKPQPPEQIEPSQKSPQKEETPKVEPLESVDEAEPQPESKAEPKPEPEPKVEPEPEPSKAEPEPEPKAEPLETTKLTAKQRQLLNAFRENEGLVADLRKEMSDLLKERENLLPKQKNPATRTEEIRKRLLEINNRLGELDPSFRQKTVKQRFTTRKPDGEVVEHIVDVPIKHPPGEIELAEGNLEKAQKAFVDSLGLERPYLRESTREAIINAAPRNAEGKFIGPDGKVIEDKPVFGHKYGREHRRLVIEAAEKGMTQEQFNNWVNDHPEWFQIESEKYNLSHKGEKPGID